jgi:type II secretory pathway component PulF
MRFLYSAKRGLQDVVEGTIDAENEQEVLNRLTAEGLFPVSVRPADQEKSAQKQAEETRVNKRITSRDILDFTNKLATLTRARVELLSGLRILYEQTENERFRKVINEIYDSIKEGKSFSDSLARFPRVFSPLFVNIIKAGETTGRLDAALEQMSDFLSRQESLKNRVIVALAYPTLLLLVGFMSIFILITFVVPRLKPIFDTMGNKLPAITKVILAVSMMSYKVWWLLFGLIAGVLLFLVQEKGRDFMQGVFRKIMGMIPVLKRLVRNQELIHFSRALSLLIRSGVSAVNSLEIASSGIADNDFRAELKGAGAEVSSGQSLSRSLGKCPSLPAFFNRMIAVGEESGRLPDVLDEITGSYTQQVDSDIALITSLLEPVLIFLLGVVLGSIVLAILLPTFQITQFVR